MDQMEIDPKDSFSFYEEFKDIQFGDKRLNKRFRCLAQEFYKRPSSAIPTASGSWSKTIGAYRMFNNSKIACEEIIRSHGVQLGKRIDQYDKVICPQDTTSLSFGTHLAVEEMGSIAQGKYGSRGKGLFCHTTLVMNPEGLPLGVMLQTIWSRKQLTTHDELFYTEQAKWKMSLDQVIEASKLSPKTKFIMIGDRENDFNDFILRALNHKISFVIRAKTVRVSANDDKPIVEVLKSQTPKGALTIDIKYESPRSGKKPGGKAARKAHLNIYADSFQLKIPKSKVQEKIPEDFQIHAVLAHEPNPPEGSEPITWLLFTDEPVKDFSKAHEVIETYRMRWKIEIFHKIMKSGCKIEECRLESIAKLKRYITLKSIVAYRLLYLVEAARKTPTEDCTKILKPHEWKALHLKLNQGKPLPKKPPTIKEALILVARLGGFLARKSDGDPGPVVLWRGWQRLQDYAEMFAITNSPEFTETCV